ncbi:MAG: cellobiose phosphorylase [Candidatus Omnitrophica bacterium]|nr:cellobiose phosphorylase [Candidatus Omnitrophota bacterium]
MSNNYFLQNDGSFVIKNYNSKYPFSNFLPGVAGVWGVPLWVFYVNRGQGVVSFGLEDKEHCITEFFPANKAYALASSFGFRTFVKINNKINYEPFRVVSDSKKNESMTVKSASVDITEINSELGLDFTVSYFTLPNTAVGALVRKVCIKNTSRKKIKLQVLDGLARIVPFGAMNFFLKDMSRTLEAWMHSSVEGNLANFRLIVDPKDVSQTKYIEGANFNCSFYDEKGKKKSPYLIVDPEAIFANDTSYSYPVNFFNKRFKVPLKQIYCGKTPCSFSAFDWELKPGQEKILYSVFGASFKSESIKKFTAKMSSSFLRKKECENAKIIEDIKDNALCVSSDTNFNQYLKSTYLDNVLRGGYPHKVNGNNPYYVFSRKHGDLERDYNRFKLLPSYFSEGEGNYRDINQNRRMDLFFNPHIDRKNIEYFFNLQKIDGYNPLVVKGEKLTLNAVDARATLKEFKINHSGLYDLICGGFYLGEIFKFAEEEGINLKRREDFVRRIVERATRKPSASFGEGFWIDHWHYNLDLIETYLYFYPDRAEDLFLSKEYYYWDDEHRVKGRKHRYHIKGDKIYQFNSLESVKSKKIAIADREDSNFLHTRKNKICQVNLVEKLLVLILNKVATLDPEGIGVQMEANKPGWCDSLNGMPALFGSSLCETIELKRACIMLSDTLINLKTDGIRKIVIGEEVHSFLDSIIKLVKDYLAKPTKQRDFQWWDKASIIKESFRNKTFVCVSGKEKKVNTDKIVDLLKALIKRLNVGIGKAKNRKTGVHSTYFTYAVTKYNIKNKFVEPLEFKKHVMPLFLEGPMHALRVEGKEEMHKAVRACELFDKKLKMYRLNAPLSEEPLEIGRSRIFVPGWLENETVWLHMEYKYLLEVLKNGLYKEFYKDFYNCCVCFFDPEVYGRSILENSSFIVSSVYPDKNLWGRGFVARLSGATVELLNMWVVMIFGSKPFFIDDEGRLVLKFSPALKHDMFTTKKETVKINGRKITVEKNTFSFKLFSSILVVYHNPKRKDTFSNDCCVKKIVVEAESKKITIYSDTIKAPLSYAIREVKAERIDVYFD